MTGVGWKTGQNLALISSMYVDVTVRTLAYLNGLQRGQHWGQSDIYNFLVLRQ